MSDLSNSRSAFPKICAVPPETGRCPDLIAFPLKIRKRPPGVTKWKRNNIVRLFCHGQQATRMKGLAGGFSVPEAMLRDVRLHFLPDHLHPVPHVLSAGAVHQNTAIEGHFHERAS